ncbi:hypothetical protein Pst134EB_030748 [Puccinia striiformis f. sp. tritici]|nr:hypothetical protein Pst134EB_030748 [Puccinia striiformis f. sp. tritici]
MKEMAESADLPESHHWGTSESDQMGTHSTQADVDWIQEMCLMDTDPQTDMIDYLTQASVAQRIEEAHHVQSTPTPLQVPHSFHEFPHSLPYGAGPSSLDSLVMDTPINTIPASSVGKHVTPGSQDQKRKRLRDWQFTPTGREGQDFYYSKPSHSESGISEFDHSRASQTNQVGPSHTTTSYMIPGKEGPRHKLTQFGQSVQVENQRQSIFNKITHYPGYSMANFGSHPMTREIQLNIPGLTRNKYITTQASEGQQTQQAETNLSNLLQNKVHEKPTELSQTVSGNKLRAIERHHIPKIKQRFLDDITPPSELLNLSSHRMQKLQCGDQIEPYKDYYKYEMMKIYQNFEASTNSPVLKKIGDWDVFIVEIQQANTHPPDSVALMIPSTVEGTFYTMARLYSIFIQIQQWLTQVHSILWKQFKGDICPQTDHQRMMIWFLQEVFNPQYGIPILGRTYMHKLINANFGPVQIWLLNLLQEEQSIYTTCIAISAIWFKKTLPQQWKRIYPYDEWFWLRRDVFFGEDIFPTDTEKVEELQEVMLSKLNQAIGNFNNDPQKLDPKIGTPCGLSYKHIGDFKLTFNSWKFPVHPICGAQSDASKEILKKNEEITKHAGRRSFHICVKNTELGIAIATSPGYHGMYFIRLLTKETGKITNDANQKHALSRVVDCLEFYSDHLISSLPELLNAKSFHQTRFLKWIHTNLYGNDTTSILPIHGIVRKSFFKKATVPTFDPVQIFIILNFTRNDRFKNRFVATTLFGYWLKTENKHFWNSKFKTDDDFSTFLTTVLKVEPSG